MDAFKIILFFICVITLLGENYCQGCTNDLTGKSSAVRLSYDLLCGYNRNIRPVMNMSTKIQVKTWIHITHFIMDEKYDMLYLNVQLMMIWKDEFLVWDPSKYDDIKSITEDSMVIWIPDIISYEKGFNGDSNNNDYYNLPPSLVKIRNDGMVTYYHTVTLTGYCAANIAKWPFDFHNCTLYLGYRNNLVNFIFPDGYYTKTLHRENREWKLVDFNQGFIDVQFSSINNISNQHRIIQYNFNIQRFSSMYYSSVIVPALVIALMRTFTFLMGRETSLRIVLLCLFFISELLYLQFIDTKLPNNGDHFVYIVLLFRNSLILTAITLVISVISNELYKRGTEDFPRNSPEWLKHTSTFLLNTRTISLLTNFNRRDAELLIENNVEENAPNSQRENNAVFWKTLSVLLDRLSFVIILVLSLINFLFLFP